MQFQMPADYNKVQWYGNGPHETYADRKTSGKIGFYQGTVANQHFPYITPQENGNKTNVRWATVTNQAGTGLLAISDSVFNLNVHDYTDKDLLAAKKRGAVLNRGSGTTVNIDLAQMGLGGDDSWSPRVHEAYLLPAKTYSYAFRLRTIENTTNIEQLASTRLPYTGKTSSGETVTIEDNTVVDSEEDLVAEDEVKAPVRKTAVRKAAVRKAPVRKKVVKKKSSRRRRR
jgi:beta-galactosidase